MTFDPNAAAPKDSGIFGLPYTPDEALVVLLPVPWDATTSYGSGAADGPRAIMDASKQVDFVAFNAHRYQAVAANFPEAPALTSADHVPMARPLSAVIRERRTVLREDARSGIVGNAAFAVVLAVLNNLGAIMRAAEAILFRFFAH